MSFHIFLTLMVSVVVLASSCMRHDSSHEKIQPATVELSAEGGPARVILTADARKRLAIESRPFTQMNGGPYRVPSSALLYDNVGHAWVFTESESLKFQRVRVRVLSTREHEVDVRFEQAEAGSLPIVVHGAAELHGTEFGIGK